MADLAAAAVMAAAAGGGETAEYPQVGARAAAEASPVQPVSVQPALVERVPAPREPFDAFAVRTPAEGTSAGRTGEEPAEQPNAEVPATA